MQTRRSAILESSDKIILSSEFHTTQPNQMQEIYKDMINKIFQIS